MQSYFALVHKDPDSDYGVSFPDLPGCISAGETLEEAREMASQALSLHLASMRDDGEQWPAPSSIDAVASLDDARDAIAILLVEPELETTEAAT